MAAVGQSWMMTGEDTGDPNPVPMHATPPEAKQQRKFWWVNQNKTYVDEIRGGFLWSPTTKSNGARNPYYDTMCDVRVGDVVFSFYKSRIQNWGTIVETAQRSPKPNFGDGDQSYWNTDGWLVKINFEAVAQPFRPKAFIDEIRPLLPEKYSPLQHKNGNGVQPVYLTGISEDFATLLLRLGNVTLGA